MTYAPPMNVFMILNIHFAPDLAGIRNYSNTAEKSAIMNRSHLPASHPVSTIITKLLALVSTARPYGNSERCVAMPGGGGCTARIGLLINLPSPSAGSSHMGHLEGTSPKPASTT